MMLGRCLVNSRERLLLPQFPDYEAMLGMEVDSVIMRDRHPRLKYGCDDRSLG